jgi:hypothetical protein
VSAGAEEIPAVGAAVTPGTGKQSTTRESARIQYFIFIRLHSWKILVLDYKFMRFFFKRGYFSQLGVMERGVHPGNKPVPVQFLLPGSGERKTEWDLAYFSGAEEIFPILSSPPSR